MHGFADEPFAVAHKDVQGDEDVLYLFFTTSDASVTRGWEFVQPIFARTDGRDEAVSLGRAGAHREHVCAGRAPTERPLQDLPRRRSRLPVPAPRRVRQRGQSLPRLEPCGAEGQVELVGDRATGDVRLVVHPPLMDVVVVS